MAKMKNPNSWVPTTHEAPRLAVGQTVILLTPPLHRY